MNKIKLAVIFGGMSTEHNVSVVSGTSVIKNLDKDKYEILPLYIDKEGNWYKYTKDVNEVEILEIGQEVEEIELLDNYVKELKTVDVIFPVLHGLYGEDGSIQGLFELIKKPYVGCDILSSSVCMNKIYTKIVFEKAKINCAKDVIINYIDNKLIYIDDQMNFIESNIDDLDKVVEEKLNYPVFIKPSNSGSSIGVNKANNKEELDKYIKEAAKYDKEILIEEQIVGREIECAVLGNNEIKVSNVGEVLSADEYYDYDSKYINSESKTVIPANIDSSISEEIRKTAVKAFKAAHGKGLSRVDFFVDKNNKIYINEINTLPGFTNISMYAKLWDEKGLKYKDLLDELIDLAIKK